MQAHELINAIQQRLHKRVTFRQITVGHQSTVEFVWGHRPYYAIGGQDITIYQIVEPNVIYATSYSERLQNVIRGGVRDDMGNLIQGPAV